MLSWVSPGSEAGNAGPEETAQAAPHGLAELFEVDLGGKKAKAAATAPADVKSGRAWRCDPGGRL
eukprot:CAMPEP_0197702270 /NCGR_PEP_ID=MMETSP1338-20131121/124291_1 /TAXON_ID=43686 ORGANISM="Pelagodinium beii, Strain RCC1491" /NCGR_SAMPLE_ID=MMETSP1338 /ASSEMBLY_ACC=CAM_ASM_000754 /LENGTH=64 /DNA_ID=CAMNT_0043286079 /DNA_START=281 /DNA_END=475 /DNA_ORIENTATION=-